MKKVIAAINITVDGYCDHTYGVPDAEIHQHYADLLEGAAMALYGRTTYQLMTYWRTVLEHPTGIKAMDDFAKIMDRTPKLVFSRTLKETNWESATLSTRDLQTEILDLKRAAGSKPVLVCSPSLIVAATELHLIDEYQLCIHPVIGGSGLPLFKNITEKISLKLLQTKTFSAGQILLYYAPAGRAGADHRQAAK